MGGVEYSVVSLDGDEQVPGNNIAVTRVVGIGAIIIPRLLTELTEDEIAFLTVQERIAKEETGRTVGRRGIIQETIKVDETHKPEEPIETLQAALLEEVLGQEGMGDIGDKFHRVGGPEIAFDSLPGKGGKIEIVIYDGPPESLLDRTSEEVMNTRFDTVASFLHCPIARATSTELVTVAYNRGLLNAGVGKYDCGEAQMIFPREFNPIEFEQKRNKRQDITRFVR